MFHHTPDDLIFVRDQANPYMAPLDDFRADLAALALPDYSDLPEGIHERRYDGVRHLLFSASAGQMAGGEFPEGDVYLANAAALVAQRADTIAAEESARRTAFEATLPAARKVERDLFASHRVEEIVIALLDREAGDPTALNLIVGRLLQARADNA